MSDSSTIWSLRIACGRSPNSAAACSVQDLEGTVRPTVRLKLSHLIVLRISADRSGSHTGAETRRWERELGVTMGGFLRAGSVHTAASRCEPDSGSSIWTYAAWCRWLRAAPPGQGALEKPRYVTCLWKCHGTTTRQRSRADKFGRSAPPFRNSSANMHRGYPGDRERGDSGQQLEVSRRDPYPPFFARFLVEAQVKRKRQAFLAGDQQTTFCQLQRHVDLNEVGLIVKDLLRKETQTTPDGPGRKNPDRRPVAAGPLSESRRPRARDAPGCQGRDARRAEPRKPLDLMIALA